jgi:hypothetical protein
MGVNVHLIHPLFSAISYWNFKKAYSILLGDPAYATINTGLGGIFVSSIFAPSMWGGILSNDKSATGIVINAIYFQQRRHVCTLRCGTERNDRCTQQSTHE